MNKSYGDCWRECAEKEPEGTELFVSYVACTDQFCSGDKFECDSKPQTSCERCLHENCGREWIDVMASREGFLWFTCNGECSMLDNICYTMCADMYPQTLPSLARMAECQASQCPHCKTTMF